MKDKLVKTGRKGTFYKARRFFLATLFLATLSATVTVTTVVMNVQGKTKAQEDVVETEITHEDNDGELALLY